MRVGLLVVVVFTLAASTAAAAIRQGVGYGIVLQRPTGWYVTNEPLSEVSDPVQRFVLSSYRLPADASAEDGYVPSSNGVVAQVMEEVPANASPDWRPRPQRFTLPRLGRVETLGGNRWGELLFSEHGRHFYIFIWVGSKASSTEIGQLLRALNGMTISSA
jgi:hypothetical protein